MAQAMIDRKRSIVEQALEASLLELKKARKESSTKPKEKKKKKKKQTKQQRL